MEVSGLPGGAGGKNPPASAPDPLEQGMAFTAVVLPRESQGQRSLVGYGP